MEFNDYQPIYIQIMDYIKFQIIRGELNPGDKIPSVRDIALLLKVNPNTVQRAYQDLDREGITYSKRGLGSFVVDDEERIISLKDDKATEITSNFVSNMKQLGVEQGKAIDFIKRSWDQ
ncbi:MAG: GntR family transcriptional regulator [Tissierellia bacterium]|nr:GntR family transcriptional regulator [Tissierellia bacterium]